MSLLKVPLLVSVMGCMYATMTPPTHTPPKSEQLPPTGLELVAPWFPYIPKVGHWTSRAIVLGLSICEITGIVACKLPSDAAVQLTELLTFSTPTTALNLGITPIFLCGWALNLAGTLFRVACYRALGRQFTFELSIRADHRLVTTGPYALVRHPSYTCAILSGVGALLAHLSRGSWVMECLDLHGLGVRRRWICVGAASIAALALVPRMNKEDGMLKKHFGKDWENWKDAVPYRLFPGVY
ncbi:Protein-S-isoprenylcysteine O-methyltransferase [Pleurotus pulmonarius]